MASFSSDVKNELARLKIDEKYEIVELGAFLRISGSVIFGGEIREIVFSTILSATARRLTTFLRHIAQADVEVSVSKTPNLKKVNSYKIKLFGKENCKELLKLTGMENFPFEYDPMDLKSFEEKRAFLRAAFLAQGSITAPEKGYHLEITVENEEVAEDIAEIFKNFDINSGIIARREKYIVYIKNSQMISDALQVFGAVSTLFHYEDVMAMKDFKNSIQRQVNCDSYNVDRVIKASIRQRRAIELLAERGKMEELSPKLLEAASLRMENPEDSLSALAKMCTPPATKQDMARRLKKIEKIASEYN